MLRCCEKKEINNHKVLISYQCFVGMTRLELATSRPPDVCATNCATSRSLLKRECKGRQIAGYCQIYTLVFDKKSYLALFSPILIMWFAFFLLNLQIQTDAA